jgi:hypothetical protein
MADLGVRPVGARVHRRGGRSLNSRVVQIGALVLSFIAVSVLVVTSSRAAFVAQNDNVTNQVTSAAVDLTDTDSGTAMFDDVTGLMPGTTEQRCIDVTYNGTVDPLAVKLYSSGAPTSTLAPYLDLTIEVGSDPSPVFRDCNGFVPAGILYSGTVQGFSTGHGSYAAGVPAWDPGIGPETRTFRFSLSVQDVPAAEGLTTTFGYSWETRTS